jgi:hypothetical protein
MNQIKWDGEKLSERENQLIGYLVHLHLRVFEDLHGIEPRVPLGSEPAKELADRALVTLRSFFPDLNFRGNPEGFKSQEDPAFKVRSLPGKHTWIMCPFHEDKRPSLTVHESGVFYCHSCGKNGDARDFIRFYAEIRDSDVSKPTPETTVQIPTLPTHCPVCKAAFRHIGHPFYPGAIMMSVCDCTPKYTPDGHGNTIITMEPPAKSTQ